MSLAKNTPATVKVGMGATICYPQDAYPAVVTKVSKTGKVITVERLETVSAKTGHKPARFDGPFPVWSHTYTDEELQSMRTGATAVYTWRESTGTWGPNVRVGSAHYERNYSY